MTEPTARIALRLDPGPDADAEELDELTRQLLRELTELELISIELGREGPPPPGARAVDSLTLGTLAVTAVRSMDTLRAVVAALQSWLSGPRQRSVKLELDGDVIEVTGVSSADQRRLIANWIDRHASLPAQATSRS